MRPDRSAHRRPASVSGKAAALAALGAVLLVAACGGGSSTGGGTLDSPFVGRYSGTTAVTVTTGSGKKTIEDAVSIYVNPDGLVQFGDKDSTIYASGPLRETRVHIDRDAAALVDSECTGTIVLSGAFSNDGDGNAVFQGDWSSSNAACFGVTGDVTGPVSAERASNEARASRVFETSNPAMLRAFQGAADQAG